MSLALSYCSDFPGYSRRLTDECNKLRKQSANNVVMETTWSGYTEQFHDNKWGGKMLAKDLVRLQNFAQPASHMSERVSQNVEGAHSKRTSDMLHNFSCMTAVYDVNMNLSLPGAARCPKQN